VSTERGSMAWGRSSLGGVVCRKETAYGGICVVCCFRGEIS
jgi:hypothetical protein